jgi:hypothetical protein
MRFRVSGRSSNVGALAGEGLGLELGSDLGVCARAANSGVVNRISARPGQSQRHKLME